MYKKIVLIGIIALSMVGCKKPPTEVQNLSGVGTGTYPTNIGDLTTLLADAYANERSPSLNGFQTLCKTNASSEHTADLNYGGDLSWSELEYNDLSSSNTYAADSWSGNYTGIKDANSTLAAADFLQKNYIAATDAATISKINQIRGEAYFLRAYYYMQLECFFGQKYIDIKQPATSDANILGVPIYTKIPTTLAQTQQARSSARDVWHFITSDLTTAATLLNGVVRTAVDAGRVTDWSARALLGKAYIYTQNWDSARIVLANVITNGTNSKGALQLMPFSTYKQAFNSNVHPGALNNNSDQEFNSESLFEINVDRVPASYGIFGGSPNLNLTTSMGLIWAPTGLVENGTADATTGMGYANASVQDKNLLRFGFNIPVDSIAKSTLLPNQNYNATQPGYYTSHKVAGVYYTTTSQALRTNKTVDPRLYVCALQPYLDTVYFAFPSGGSGEKRPVGKCVNLPAPDHYQGWSFKKYQTLDARLDDITQADGANYYLLRLSDVYLLYAESLIHLGQVTGATGGLEYINKIHRRAYGLPINSAAASDYTSTTSATMADPSDVNLANNPLAYERYAELFAEGHWWFDVCRWGNSTTGTSGYYNTAFGVNEGTYYGNLLPNNTPSRFSITKSYSFPIPLPELNSNSLITSQDQNPGY